MRCWYTCIIQILRLLHESGLLQKEPMKLFSKQETKMDTSNSKVKLRSKPVRKQVTSSRAAKSRSIHDTTSLISSSPVNSELQNQVNYTIWQKKSLI